MAKKPNKWTHVPKVQFREEREIESWAHATLCKLFKFPQNSFQPYAYLRMFENGGLSALGLGYGIEELPDGEDAHFDPANKEIILSEAIYLELQKDTLLGKITLAHEVGHGVMHAKVLREMMTNGQGVRLYKRSSLERNCDPEWQADIFATGLVLPSRELTKFMRAGYSVTRLASLIRVPRNMLIARINDAQR